MREHSARTVLLTGGPVGDCGLAFRLDTFPCFLLPVLQVEDQMGRLYFGKVKFLLGMAFPRFWGSFDGSAGFWRIGFRRIPIVGKIDGRYVWWKQGPFGTSWRDSVRKADGAYPLSNILLAGGQRNCYILRVPQSNSPSSGTNRPSGVRRRIGVPNGNITRGNRLKGMKLTSAGVSDARNDPAQAFSQRLLDPVSVRDSVDWNNGLGHGHPADLSVVVTQAGEDGAQYLPGLVWSQEPAQQRRKGGVHLRESGLGPGTNTLEAGQYKGPEYLA